MTTAANYYEWKTGPWALLVIEVIENGRRIAAKEFIIPKGKRNARKEAAKHNAEPWNF